jgi:hypothetical protein
MFPLSSMAAPSQSNQEAWVRRYNASEAGSRDNARKVVVDADGNIVVAGDTDDGFTGADFLTIKYSGEGVALWTNRYGGSATVDDRVYALGVDQAGNVFVAGSSGDAIATLGYSPAGVPLWTNHYNGPANIADIPQALAVNYNGNVFVTGYSTGPGLGGGSSAAYVTIAYSGAGVPLWTNRYGSGSAYAFGVAVDRSGNAFVTGLSERDYATIAYSGAGVPLWTNLYNGGAWETAIAIGVDNAGNVFVTGSSYILGGAGGGPGWVPHFATIAYSPAGVAVWTNRYPSSDYALSAAALAVDHNGSVFVTGYSPNPSTNGSNADYVTIAYSGSGLPLWTNGYAGPGNSEDSARAVAVDGSGNVFVTGYSRGPGGSNEYATIAYSGGGVPLWTNRYRPAEAYAVAVNSDGNVFVTGSEYATIAYSGAGTVLWTNRYDGPFNSRETAAAVAVDQSTGNVLVSGSSSTAINSDYVTIAYSDAGVALWTNSYNGPANRRDEAAAVAVDGTGNVIVTGSSSGGAAFDYATIAYSRSGVPLWTNRYNGPGNSDDNARAIAVDSDGNVIVTGSSVSSLNNYDYATIAYSRAGVALWTNRYNGPDGVADLSYALAVDNDGNVFVTGSSGTLYTTIDRVTIAYSRAGVALWTNRYSGLGRANAIAVDHLGRVFVTGGSSTIAYSRTGLPLWTKLYYSEGALAIAVNHIAVDHHGNLFVAGHSTGSGNDWDYATIAYSGAGVALWTNRYNGTGNSNDQANAVMVDNNGNVFVTGYSIGQGRSYDYATVAYSGTGVALWTNRYNGPANGPDQPGLSLSLSQNKCLAIGPNSEVYVTGSSDGHYGDQTVSDYATIKYVWRPRLAIQPIVAGSSTVNLTLSGPKDSPWAVQRAAGLTSPWINLGVSVIGTNGLGVFSDANPPARGAVYRATQPQ